MEKFQSRIRVYGKGKYLALTVASIDKATCQKSLSAVAAVVRELSTNWRLITMLGYNYEDDAPGAVKEGQLRLVFKRRRKTDHEERLDTPSR